MIASRLAEEIVSLPRDPREYHSFMLAISNEKFQLPEADQRTWRMVGNVYIPKADIQERSYIREFLEMPIAELTPEILRFLNLNQLLLEPYHDKLAQAITNWRAGYQTREQALRGARRMGLAGVRDGSSSDMFKDSDPTW